MAADGSTAADVPGPATSPIEDDEDDAGTATDAVMSACADTVPAMAIGPAPVIDVGAGDRPVTEEEDDMTGAVVEGSGAMSAAPMAPESTLAPPTPSPWWDVWPSMRPELDDTSPPIPGTAGPPTPGGPRFPNSSSSPSQSSATKDGTGAPASVAMGLDGGFWPGGIGDSE